MRILEKGNPSLRIANIQLTDHVASDSFHHGFEIALTRKDTHQIEVISQVQRSVATSLGLLGPGSISIPDVFVFH